MQISLVTAPTGQAVSLDEVKVHLRVDHTNEDGYIQALVMAAAAQVENITRRAILTQTWDVFFDDWPGSGHFVLPFGNLQSVTQVKYTDEDGTEYTWDAGEYHVDTDSEPGRVVLEYDKSWPTATLHPSNPIQIRIVCGYGDHALQSITGATNATPIAITSTDHGLSTGDRVLVSSVGGNTNANGAWHVTVADDDTFSLDGSAGNAAYTSGGQFVHLAVPEPIRAATLMMVADAYQNRESVVVGNVSHLPAVENLLWPYRLWI